MLLKRAVAKRLLEEHHVGVPHGRVISSPEEMDAHLHEFNGNHIVLKALIPEFTKDKTSTRVVPMDQVKTQIQEMLNTFNCKHLMVEQHINYETKMYVALSLDPITNAYCYYISEYGGININEFNKRYPNSIIRIPLTSFDPKEIFPHLKHLPEVIRIINICKLLFDIMQNYDCTFLEIRSFLFLEKKLFATDFVVDCDPDLMHRHAFTQHDFEPLPPGGSKGNIAILTQSKGAGLMLAQQLDTRCRKIILLPPFCSEEKILEEIQPLTHNPAIKNIVFLLNEGTPVPKTTISTYAYLANSTRDNVQRLHTQGIKAYHRYAHLVQELVKI